jgi:threonine dehydrogenase-like Zn-dependent dehydrogenase
MRALVYGVQPEPSTAEPTGNPLLDALANTPMQLQDVDEPVAPRDDWVITRPRLTGICGSDAKQVFMDWGSNVDIDNPMIDFASFPQVLGHEVVANVVAVGADSGGLEVGDRVVLNPWLSCAPRGFSPLCPACEIGDLSLCWHFTDGPLAPGIHIGTSRDLPGGYANLMTAHHSMLFKVPDNMPDEIAVFADPFAVSLHAITRHPPAHDGRALVYGAGALGSCAVAILRALYPDVEVGVVARFDAQRKLSEQLGAHRVFQHEPLKELIEEIAGWSGGVLRGHHEMPMAYPGGVDVVYDTVSHKDSLEVSTRILKARGTLVKAGVHGPTAWEWTPLYFKELSWVGSNAFGFEEVDGERKHGIQHYLDLASSGRVDIAPMLTHTFPLEDWRDAFTVLATQGDSGAIKVAFDQRN